jgi:hypothetical protein
MKRPYVVAALLLVGLAAVWQLWLGPRWTIRVPRDAVFVSKYVGIQTNADPITGVVPTQDVLTTYDRIIRVIDRTDWPRSVVVQDQYTAHDIKTGAINFEYIANERIDPRTGTWAEGPHAGEIVLFPRNTQKRTYTMRGNYIPGLPLAFVGEDDIGGLNLYKFSYVGPIDLTPAFAGTPESPGVKVLAGQYIACADDQFYLRIWVEPRTGSQVKVEEGCMSGDFVYDKSTGRKIAAVDRWNGVTTGASLAARISEVYLARRNYMWASLYLPGFLLLAAVVILAVGYSRRDRAVTA